MSADFAEEHSTSTLAAERIDAETSERLRLERELQDVTEANKNLQQTTERLEMELLYARAADLNGLTSDLEDGEDGGVYKQRYEHAIRELEFTKRKMAQQHEDDLEQLVGLKKQLEKKVIIKYPSVGFPIQCNSCIKAPSRSLSAMKITKFNDLFLNQSYSII